MADQTKTTGTETQDDGNSVEQTPKSVTSAGDDRNAESGEQNDWKALAISLQEKAKEVNDLRRELDELKNGTASPPVTQSPEVQQKTDQIDAILSGAEEWERKGDKVAALALRTRAELLATQRDLILERQLNRIPQDRQDKVLNHFNKNRHRLGDIVAADAELKAPTLEDENKKLRERIAALEKGPDPDVVKAPPTGGREVTARQVKLREMTEDEFDAEAARLGREQGNVARLKFIDQVNGPNPGIRLKR